MLRTTIGLTFTLVLAGLVACSSKSTGDDDGGGGSGMILSGGTSGGGASGGGVSSGGASAGVSGNVAGTANAAAGKPPTGGATNTAGAGGVCAGQTISCVDEIQARGCNLMTGVVETYSCVDEYAAIGFASSGCGTDSATGEEDCLVTGVLDEACKAGTSAYARCAGATTNEQLFNIYVNCFLDNEDAHTIVPCFSQYVTQAMMTDADCDKAVEACFPAEGGAGPGTGAGGAP